MTDYVVEIKDSITYVVTVPNAIAAREIALEWYDEREPQVNVREAEEDEDEW